jgi:hypothetical protein
MVRAKFRVESKTEHLTHTLSNDNKTYIKGKLITVNMNPVHYTQVKNDKNEWVIPESENTKFWKATPSGQIALGCINPETANQFELGKEYYIDFHPADNNAN